MEKKIIRKGTRKILQQTYHGELEYLVFPKLAETKMVEHVIATRVGGVSKGIYGTMNFGYMNGDKKEAVDENYLRVAQALHSDCEHIVCTHQTHTTNVRVVTKEDAGKGVVKQKDYQDIDGLVTNVPGLVLAIFFADCVPLLFVDPVHKAIGMAHSGWRGTVGKIGLAVVKKMQEVYGTNPKDIISAIGPSICQDCYEVSEDVADVFYKLFEKNVDNFQKKFDENPHFYKNLPNANLFFKDTTQMESLLLRDKGNKKYQLNLWMANFMVMLEAGILPENISVTDICTCCNPSYLFSHRASAGKRGNLGAFMKII